MMKDLTPAEIQDAIEFVAEWRDNDEELRIPSNDFGSNLAWAVDTLVTVARESKDMYEDVNPGWNEHLGDLRR